MGLFDKIFGEPKQKKSPNVATMEHSVKRMPDKELLTIFADYFAPNKDFINLPGSPKYKAYYNAINAATREMLNNPELFAEATKRNQSELAKMCDNRIPGITNSLICGLIFCVGKFAVVPSRFFCVGFSEAIPNCIALYLLLTAQKLPAAKRQQTIDTGDSSDKKPLTAAMDSLSICDPNWEYKIL